MRKLSKGHRSADEKHREHELRSMLISLRKLSLCNYSSNNLQKKRALSPLQPPWQIWCSLWQGNQAWSRAGQLGLENAPFWCLHCWREVGLLLFSTPFLPLPSNLPSKYNFILLYCCWSAVVLDTKKVEGARRNERVWRQEEMNCWRMTLAGTIVHFNAGAGAERNVHTPFLGILLGRLGKGHSSWSWDLAGQIELGWIECLPVFIIIIIFLIKKPTD